MATVGRTFARLGAVALVRAAAVLLGFVATVAVAGVAWGAQDALLAARTPTPTALRIDGSISGVVPGAPSAELRLTLRNDTAAAAAVSHVAATASGSTACPAALLQVGTWHGALTVPPLGAATVTLPVAVAADLPPECASATWDLRYSAQ